MGRLTCGLDEDTSIYISNNKWERWVVLLVGWMQMLPDGVFIRQVVTWWSWSSSENPESWQVIKRSCNKNTLFIQCINFSSIFIQCLNKSSCNKKTLFNQCIIDVTGFHMMCVIFYNKFESVKQHLGIGSYDSSEFPD